MNEVASAETTIAPKSTDLQVTNPYTGELLGRVAQVGIDGVPELLARAQRGARIGAALPRHVRASVLDGAADLMIARRQELEETIVSEAGKTVRQARAEVSRAINTVRLSAAEARRNAGEVIPFDAYPGSENRKGWFTRDPLGIIVAITPYNDALNLVAHKLGPAIAGGNSVLLKPSDHTPMTAQLFVDLLLEAGLPGEVITVVHGDSRVAEAMVSAREVRMVSFTGGFETAGRIAAAAGIKRLAMELGGNAPILVFDDADLEQAVEAIISGAFWAAGQNCIGAQRVLVQRGVYAEFERLFTEAVMGLVAGDPASARTDVGPMISREKAIEARELVTDAIGRGAALLAGGDLVGSVLDPTVLANVPASCKVWAEEVFAPIVALGSFADEEEAVRLANSVEYSLHAGVFTSDLNRAMAISSAIEAGGVLINDSSDYRFDAMPFGGYKYGSMGREGVRFAYEEMTQPKVICMNL